MKGETSENKKGVDLNRKGLEDLKGVVNGYFFHIILDSNRYSSRLKGETSMNKKGVDLNREGLDGLTGVVNRYF